MEQAGIHLAIGISYGILLFLIASGLSLIFGVMGILNMAHGSLYLIGAYIGVTLARTDTDFWLYLIPAGLFVGLVGVLIERLLLSRLHGQFNEQVLVTVGLIFIFENLFMWVMGPFQLLGTTPSALDFSVALGGYTVPVYRFFITLVGLAIFAVLWWVIEKTKAGATVRAGMDDKEMLTGLGVNYVLVCSAVFFLGTAVAGIAGYIAAPWLGAEFRMGLSTLVLALIAIIIGGVGSVQGTLLGALLIGLIDAFSKAYAPQLASFLPYILFIIILLTRPTGILGRRI